MRLAVLLVPVLLAAAALGLSIQSGSGASPPPPGAGASRGTPPPRLGAPLVREGQPGRAVLGGRWYFRLDDEGVGVRRRYMTVRTHAGWRPISVPYDWNGSERKLNRSSVGWYRRELTLPPTARGTRWIVRFEGAGHQSTVYLNGRQIGRHTGNYLPFEADLRGARPGRNMLVVRVSSLRTPDDLTHWRPSRFHRLGQRRVVELRRHPPRGDPAPGPRTRHRPRPGPAANGLLLLRGACADQSAGAQPGAPHGSVAGDRPRGGANA